MNTVALDSTLAAAAPAESPLPLLRSDIHSYRGASATDGSPTWTLYDPARNLFFSLGWMEHAMLTRWNLGTPAAVVNAVNRDTTLTISEQQVLALADFLVTKNLVITKGAEAIGRLEHQLAARGRYLAGRLLQKYLFYRIPLVRPDRFLSATAGWLDYVLTRSFAVVLMTCLLTGLFLTMRQWDSFTTTFSYLYSPTGIAWLVVALLLAKTAHELGHAWMAKRHGLRVPTMGVAFLVFWPVLYTDTTEAWKLTERKQRLAISAAGIAAEFIVAVAALLLWNLMPDGPARSAVFIIATTSWLITVLVNSNPFVRFDGYYLLADYLDMPNLQDRSFELARWKMREWLFGLGESAPGTVPVNRRKALILFAWATWVYRLLLFTGIALFIYHVLFKLAGIVLLASVISWFVLRPLYMEMTHWKSYRQRMHWNRQTSTSLVLLLGGILMLFIPWKSDIHAPAMARYSSYTHIYPPDHGRIVTVAVQSGDQVSTGQLLFQLDSPELAHRESQAQTTVEMLRLQLAQKSTQTHMLDTVRTLQSELARAMSEQAGYRELRQQLAITSPIDGVVAEITDALTPGRWVNDELQLVLIVNTTDLVTEAWLEESSINKVQAGDSARFYPDNADILPFDAVVKSVGRAALPALDEPYQASKYGGEIAVREQQDGSLVPNNALYKLHLSPVNKQPVTGQILLGEVRISGESQSIAQHIWQTVAAVVIRESGF